MMQPEVGQKAVYRHPGRIDGPAPGLPEITVGRPYEIKKVSRVGDYYWAGITGDNGRDFELRCDILALYE